MSLNFNKKDFFNYLKAKNIVVEETDEIVVLEDKNIIQNKNNNSALFEKLLIQNLNKNSRYFKLNPETDTFLQPNSKKVENILIEKTSDDQFNIVLIELKSTSIKEVDVKEKFKESLNWLYLLLSLEHTDGNFKVFGIVIAQRELKWNKMDDINILLSTSVRYKKKSFFTSNKAYTIHWDKLIE